MIWQIRNKEGEIHHFRMHLARCYGDKNLIVASYFMRIFDPSRSIKDYVKDEIFGNIVPFSTVKA